MFGFGKKVKPVKPSKEEERYFEQKENEAMWGFFASAKEESDRKAEHGGR